MWTYWLTFEVKKKRHLPIYLNGVTYYCFWEVNNLKKGPVESCVLFKKILYLYWYMASATVSRFSLPNQILQYSKSSVHLNIGLMSA